MLSGSLPGLAEGQADAPGMRAAPTATKPGPRGEAPWVTGRLGPQVPLGARRGAGRTEAAHAWLRGVGEFLLSVEPESHRGRGRVPADERDGVSPSVDCVLAGRPCPGAAACRVTPSRDSAERPSPQRGRPQWGWGGAAPAAPVLGAPPPGGPRAPSVRRATPTMWGLVPPAGKPSDFHRADSGAGSPPQGSWAV